MQNVVFKKNQKIELFQLENLLGQIASFTLYSFVALEDMSELGKKVFATCKVICPVPKLNQLLQLHQDRMSPIVLVCSKGWQSNFLAMRLEAKGYKNIFVLEGGLRPWGLL